MAYHLLLPGHLVGGWPAALAGRGYLAVDVFFVLSGFVMALRYGGMFASGFRISLFAGFMRRRLARLYPLYGAIVLFRLFYTGARYGGFALPRPWIAAPLPHPWADIPANLLLVQSWGLAPSAIGPAWSISTEWAAYWAFPFLSLCMLHRGPRVAVLGCASALALLLAVAIMQHDAGQHRLLDAWDGRTAGPLLRCAGGFVLGMGVYRLSGTRAVRLAHPATGWAVLLALTVLLALPVSDLAIYPLIPALVFCLGCGAGGPAPLFALPALVWLGETSYSLYLLHIFMLHPLDLMRAAARLVLAPAPADLLAAALVLAFLLAASDASHRLIERPGRRWLSGRPAPGIPT